MNQSETVTVGRKALDTLIQSARSDHEALIAEYEAPSIEDVKASGAVPYSEYEGALHIRQDA